MAMKTQNVYAPALDSRLLTRLTRGSNPRWSLISGPKGGAETDPRPCSPSPLRSPRGRSRECAAA